jgi:hypothetical protein
LAPSEKFLYAPLKVSKRWIFLKLRSSEEMDGVGKLQVNSNMQRQPFFPGINKLRQNFLQKAGAVPR